MSQSTITLYWGTPLTPERNLEVDNFDDFLANYTSQAISSFQYVKHALDIELKIDMTQHQQDIDPSSLGPQGRYNRINYVKVVNTTSASVYYFVMKVTPRGESTILLTCHMDVINTFKEGNKGYIISPRSVIHRQHRDRFKWNEDEDALIPIIDYVDEGISPVLYKTSEASLPQFADQNWNLIYRNDENIDETAFNQDNPVTAWLCPDTPVAVDWTGDNDMKFVANDFVTGYTMFSTKLGGAGQNLLVMIKLTNNDVFGPYELTYTSSNDYGKYMIVKRSGTALDVTFGGGKLTAGTTLSYTGWLAWHEDFTNVAEIQFLNQIDEVKGTHTATAPTTAPATTNTTLIGSTTAQEFTAGIGDIDRKDARLIKIISLPFPPVLGEKTAQGFVSFRNGFVYDHGDKLFKLTLENPTFDYTTRIYSFASPMAVLSEFATTITGAENRYLDDPKLHHSAFYKPKFVYDSFTFEFAMELVDADFWYDNCDPDEFNYRFVTSTTFNSKFMFIFPDYVLSRSLTDYDNVLPISRNNELPIFTAQYVDYLRTAYRYDLKALDRSKMHAIINGLSGGLLAGASVGTKSLMGFAAGVFAVGNAVLQAQRAEDGLKSKLAQMEYQSVGVGNADDIDLLKAYTGGGAPKMCYYEVSPLMKTALDNLFYYCGYAQETAGVPDKNSRIWFNFVQADIEFERTSGVPTYALDEIKQRYSAGLTILHKYNGSFDPDQKKENWERDLIE